MSVLSALPGSPGLIGLWAAVMSAVVLAASNASATAPPEDTVIRERDYVMTLPGRWRKESTKPDGPIIYRTPAGTEQVTVTLLHSTTAQDSAAQRVTLEAVIEKHREAVLKASGTGQVKLSDVSIEERPAGPWASYFILDLPTQALSFVRINSSPWTVGTILYEQKGLAPGLAQSRALKILGHFTLTGASPGKP
jgi:hypothetical protein